MRSATVFNPPNRFGRRATAVCAAAQPPANASNDLRLFATTYAAGFLFVSLLIA